ncbi:MAG TPA: cytidylate kinase-like family protein [Dongiaceae bacterium]|nr:cytidylate kinase-like family protein [Dongiaceae bacterium]
MNTFAGYERCLNFINSQLQPPRPAAGLAGPKRAVTLSRQSGCGAHAVAEKLAEYLQARMPLPDCAWTVFDRDLMERVLMDHHLPTRMAQYMPEDRISQIDDIMHDLFCLRPDSWTLVEQTAETILRLAELGGVIIVGRGANVITAKLPQLVHVRLVAPLEQRVAAMQHYEQLAPNQARERIAREDGGRRRYLKSYFDRDIDDPLLYHLVINTGLVSLETTAQMIGDLVLTGGQSPVPASPVARSGNRIPVLT